jgi:integrase
VHREQCRVDAGDRRGDLRLPDRPRRTRRQGRHHEPATVGDPVRPPAPRPPDPTENARVVAVWEGIRRTHATRPDQATPLMPPLLWDVLDACPTTKTWKTPHRAEEPHLAGLRDRALILVGFVAALRRSELVGLDVADLAEHPNGMVIQLSRSKPRSTDGLE